MPGAKLTYYHRYGLIFALRISVSPNDIYLMTNKFGSSNKMLYLPDPMFYLHFHGHFRIAPTGSGKKVSELKRSKYQWVNNHFGVSTISPPKLDSTEHGNSKSSKLSFSPHVVKIPNSVGNKVTLNQNMKANSKSHETKLLIAVCTYPHRNQEKTGFRSDILVGLW